MTAIIIKPFKTHTKKITGEVIQNGIGYITLVVTDKNGSRSIKRFKKSDYIIQIISS